MGGAIVVAVRCRSLPSLPFVAVVAVVAVVGVVGVVDNIRIHMSGRALKPGHVPLDRALSKLGLASRAEARRLIAAGRVTVNGRVVRAAGSPVVPERARIAIDGRATDAAGPQSRRVVLLHKPRGTVTTRRDP